MSNGSNLQTASVLSDLFGRLLILNEITGHNHVWSAIYFGKNSVVTIFLLTFSLDMLFLPPYVVMGRPLFYSGDLFIHYLFIIRPHRSIT